MSAPSQNGTITSWTDSLNGYTTFTASGHDVASSLSDSVLVVFVSNTFGVNTSSATWNGTTMQRFVFGGSNPVFASAFYLLNPASGTHDIVINWGTTSDTIFINASTFTGVKSVFASADASGFGQSPSETYTPIQGDSLAVGMCVNGIAGDFATHLPGAQTQGSGQTQLDTKLYHAPHPPRALYQNRASAFYKTATAGGVSDTLSISLGGGVDNDWFIGNILLNSQKNSVQAIIM